MNAFNIEATISENMAAWGTEISLRLNPVVAELRIPFGQPAASARERVDQFVAMIRPLVRRTRLEVTLALFRAAFPTMPLSHESLAAFEESENDRLTAENRRLNADLSEARRKLFQYRLFCEGQRFNLEAIERAG